MSQQGALDLAGAIVTAIDTKDADGLGALFTEGALFINILGMPMVGRSGIVDGHRWAFGGPLQHSTVELVEATVVDGGADVAVVHAMIRRGRVAGAPAEGLPPGDTRLLLTARRDGDAWIAVAAANVAIAPPPPH